MEQLGTPSFLKAAINVAISADYRLGAQLRGKGGGQSSAQREQETENSLFPPRLQSPHTALCPDPCRPTSQRNHTQQKQHSPFSSLSRSEAPKDRRCSNLVWLPLSSAPESPGISVSQTTSGRDPGQGPISFQPPSSPRSPFPFHQRRLLTSQRPHLPRSPFDRKLGQNLLVGRRLVVLGSAPAFEEVADEEGVEDAISLVVPGPLLSGVLGESGAGTGCKEKREQCGESFRGPAREETERSRAPTLPSEVWAWDREAGGRAPNKLSRGAPRGGGDVRASSGIPARGT